MQSTLQSDHLRPPGNDTPAPVEVIEKVQALQADGKRVVRKMKRAEYNKLMSLPHEARLAYALKVMRHQEKCALAKVGIEFQLRELKAKRSKTAKRKRTQRQKNKR